MTTPTPISLRHLRTLTIPQVLEIRATYRPGVYGFGCRALATKYGVSKTVIRSVVRVDTWKWLISTKEAA